VLDPAKNDLSSGGHLTKHFFLLFSVLFHKNEYIPRVLSFKIKFSSKIDPPYCISVYHECSSCDKPCPSISNNPPRRYLIFFNVQGEIVQICIALKISAKPEPHHFGGARSVSQCSSGSEVSCSDTYIEHG
jgi:hypothetical protein